jgi:hypothetical protein
MKLHVSSYVCFVEGLQRLMCESCESCVRLDDASIVSKMPPFPFVVYSLAVFPHTVDATKPYHSLINPANGKFIFRITCPLLYLVSHGSRALAGAPAALLSIKFV